MSLEIPIPDSPNTEVNITLSGVDYTFYFTFNSRDERWRLTLSTDDEIFISSVKILENQSLLVYYDLVEFDHGDLYCYRVSDDGQDVGRDNLGIGKAYSLFYVSWEDLANA